MNHYIEFMTSGQMHRVVLGDQDALVIEERLTDAMGAPSWRRLDKEDFAADGYEKMLKRALVEAIRTNAEVQA